MTEIQAFRIGRAVYGIQFHFEADRALVERWSGDFAAMIAELRARLAGAPPGRSRRLRREGGRGRPRHRPRLGRPHPAVVKSRAPG